MKKLISAIKDFLFGASTTAGGGSKAPVDWRFATRKINKNTFYIHVTARIQSPWHIYTKLLGIPKGSLLSITYEHNAFIIISDEIKEVGLPIEGYDNALKENVRFYKRGVNFVQKVSLFMDGQVTLNGIMEYVIGDGIDRLQTYKKEFQINLNAH